MPEIKFKCSAYTIFSHQFNRCRKKANRLAERLQLAIFLKKHAINRADSFLESFKLWEQQGGADAAEYAKINYDKYIQRIQLYENDVKELERLIGQFPEKTLIGLRKVKNYAMMIQENPPSDNESD